MSVSRVKVWIAGEILTASALNSEFGNILDNGEDLGWPATKAKDLNGKEFILDSDADTSVTADTDDRIDFRLSGTDLFRMDGTVATPVNGLDWIASAAGSDVQIKAVGSDTNISVDIVPKGTGTIKAGGITIGLPRSYLAGLSLSRDAGDTDHDINILPGECRDSTNAHDIVLTSEITKMLGPSNAQWAVGDDAGGLDGTESVAGTPDASTWYYAYEIRRNDTGIVDAIFSENAASPTLPSDYDVFRRIGAVLTDGSANIIPFLQVGDRLYWKAPIQDINSTTSVTAATVTLTVPSLKVVAIVGGYVDGSAAIAVYLYSPDLTDTSPNPTAGILTFGSANDSTGAQADIQTNSSGQIRWVSSIAGRTFDMATHGWIDRRGRDD